MRASSTLRGTLPGRKPGTRTCWRERAHDVPEGSIEFGLVHFDTQADEVSLHWLCCRTHHEPITLPAAPGPGARSVESAAGSVGGALRT